MPVFEFDPAKSAANLAKHGIDFEAAQALWDDPRRVEVPARSDTEPRHLVIGAIGGRLWTAIVTDRAAAMRIISVRRSRQTEADYYERQDDQR